MLLGTVFVHPLTYAGCTLVFFGWVSLIPIPTFPGGRLLMARMGVREARSSSTQMLLLFTIVIFGILFQAFSGFSTWTVILVLASVMLLTRGTDPRFPVVLDDAAGLKNEDHRRLGLYLFWHLFLLYLRKFRIHWQKIGMKQYDMSWMKCITSSMKILQ